MKRWPVRPLGEVCAINPKLTASEIPTPDVEVTFVPMAAVDEFSVSITAPERRRYQQVAKGYTPFKENDVLFAKITPCMQNGKAAIARNLRGGLGFGSTEFHVLRPSKELLPEWVFGLIRQPSFRAAAEANLTGTGGQQRVPADFLKAFPIPVPPLAEQERIVKLLDDADALRKLRAQADRRTAALIPALFDELFGDPGTNPKGWPQHRLRELSSKFSDGPFGSNLKSSHYTAQGVRVLRLNNVGVGELLDDDKAYVSPQHFASLRKHECLPGDVLVGTLGAPNLRACVQPASIPQALNKSDCVQIRANPQVATAEFICWLLNLPSTLEMAAGMILGQTRARISMGRLAELVVPVPPLPLQQTFARRVAEIREMEAAQAASRRQLDTLFASLLHRAFAGELVSPETTSEVSLPTLTASVQTQTYLLRFIPSLLRAAGHAVPFDDLNMAVAFRFLPAAELLPIVERIGGKVARDHFAASAITYEDGAFLAAMRTLHRAGALSVYADRHGNQHLSLGPKPPPGTSEIDADARYLAPLLSRIPKTEVAPLLRRLQSEVREAMSATT